MHLYGTEVSILWGSTLQDCVYNKIVIVSDQKEGWVKQEINACRVFQ